ncbi:High-mobility group (HMG) protein [Komagataella phaffii CBS 7435]|nr:High-mobility group (HMG) protein [Komagataella phaffii CBS 7435]
MVVVHPLRESLYIEQWLKEEPKQEERRRTQTLQRDRSLLTCFLPTSKETLCVPRTQVSSSVKLESCLVKNGRLWTLKEKLLMNPRQRKIRRDMSLRRPSISKSNTKRRNKLPFFE